MSVSSLGKKYGPWALVTGASAGIGREFAEQLAASGMNLVLVARREALLNEIAQKLRSQFHIEVQVVAADLTDPTAPRRIAESVAGLDVGLLVNNAGSAVPSKVANSTVEEQVATIDLNYRSPVALTQELLGGLKARTSSGVIFVSSVIGYAPAPYMGTYGGSKQAIRQFGYLLGSEVKQDGVDVLVLSPGATRTELAEKLMSKAINMAMEPSKVVSSALKGLGRTREVVPGAMNKTMAFMNGRVLTQSAGAAINGKFAEMMMSEEVRLGAKPSQNVGKTSPEAAAQLSDGR